VNVGHSGLGPEEQSTVSRPLRFCMLTTFYPPYNFGGDGIGVQRLARGLARRGHHVTVVHDTDAYQSLSHRTPVAAADDPLVRVVPVSSGLGAVGALATYEIGRPTATARRLRTLIDGGGFDVVHFHNVSLIGGPGVLALGGDAVRLYTAHEHWLVCPTHVLWRDNREPCETRRCLRCTLLHRRPPQLWRWTRLLERQSRYVDQFLAMSEFSREKHASFGFPWPMRVLPPFLPDPDPVAGTRPQPIDPSPHTRPYFLFVGRLERIKGLDDVIPAMREHPAADLLIAGAGRHEPVLRELAAGIRNVKFLGRLETATLKRYYSHAVALVVPSIGFETFGFVLIEAFAQGTPVIARDIGPLPEIVRRSGGGVLFRTASQLLAAMQRVQHTPSLRNRLGAAGYQTFLHHWTESAVIPQYYDIIRDAARHRGLSGLVAALPETTA